MVLLDNLWRWRLVTTNFLFSFHLTKVNGYHFLPHFSPFSLFLFIFNFFFLFDSPLASLQPMCTIFAHSLCHMTVPASPRRELLHTTGTSVLFLFVCFFNLLTHILSLPPTLACLALEIMEACFLGSHETLSIRETDLGRLPPQSV